MQDEINREIASNATRVGMKVIALSFKAGRATGEALKKAMLEYLNELSHPTGEQTVAQLMKQNQGLTNIEVTDGNRGAPMCAPAYPLPFIPPAVIQRGASPEESRLSVSGKPLR